MNNNLSAFNLDSSEQIIIPSYEIMPVSHLINGSTISLKYVFSTISGYEGEDYIVLNVGTREEGDPLGPDEHGYYIYDSGDVNFSLSPTYDWIEIVGNGGQNFNFNDAYLVPDEKEQEHWRKLFQQIGAELKIGFCWGHYLYRILHIITQQTFNRSEICFYIN